MSGPRGHLRHDVPLAPYTTWRVGGPADRLYEPADRADLLDFIADLPDDEPLLWLGLGSNLLVRDGGVRGTVIRLHGALDAVELESPVSLRAEAGAHCARVAKMAREAGRAGLGFLAGIPGTIGGALAMNAGAWGGETWPRLAAVECVYAGGRTAWLPADGVRYAYRHVEPPAGVRGFLAARFRVEADEADREAEHTRQSLQRRKATQPVGRPTAGSTFRNPPGDHAARLIEHCGLKGHAIGSASVSTLHANFIISTPGGRAADIEALITHIQAVVEARTGVRLHPEVRIVGDAA